MLPKGVAQNCCGTFRGCNVARECRMALLWNDVGLKRFPRVLKESPGLFKTASMRTLQRRKRGKAFSRAVFSPRSPRLFAPSVAGMAGIG